MIPKAMDPSKEEIAFSVPRSVRLVEEYLRLIQEIEHQRTKKLMNTNLPYGIASFCRKVSVGIRVRPYRG
jgi:hypothetical protein